MRRRRVSSSSDEDSKRDSGSRKRSRIDIEQNLESLITRIGSKELESIESNLEGLADLLYADISNYKDKIIQILVNCVKNYPERMTIFSTLLGFLNFKNFSFGGEFVEYLIRHLKDSLKSSKFEIAQRIVRFVSDLVNCNVVSAESLFVLYENFVEVTLDDNIPQVRGDWYVYAVLYSLPYVGRALVEREEGRLNELLHVVEKYLNKRNKTHLDALRVWQSDDPHPQEDHLDSLWAQICNLRRQEWIEKVTWRLHTSFNEVLKEGRPHKLPQVIPPGHDEDSEYPIPYVVFRMFDYTDVDDVPGTVLPGAHAIERFLVEDQLSIIMNSLRLDRKVCAKSLVKFPCRVKLPLNYILVEMVLSHMFCIPRPANLHLFYGVMLIELCKECPETMPQVLAQATEMLFERLDTMRIDCVERFSEWFAYHLSNYQFRWSWTDWKDVVLEDMESPKARFISETLQHLVRYSYHEYIERLVPKEFAPLFPKPPGSVNKYYEGATVLCNTEVARKLTQEMKNWCDPKEALAIVKETEHSTMPVSEQGLAAGVKTPVIDVFFTVLFNISSKTFSYAFNYIDKYSSLIRALVTTTERQVELLLVLHSVWLEQPQMMVVLVEKLLRDRFIDAEGVAGWIYSPEMNQHITEFYIWEILHKTLDRVGTSVARLSQEVDFSRDKLEAFQSKIRDGILTEEEGQAPSESQLSKIEEKKDDAVRAQCGVFTLILHRHMRLMLDRTTSEEHEQTTASRTWRREMIDRMRQIMLMHYKQLHRYSETLQKIVFSKDVDPSGQLVFQQFCSLKE